MRLLRLLIYLSVGVALLLGTVLTLALQVGQTMPEGWQMRFGVWSRGVNLAPEIVDMDRGLTVTATLPNNANGLPYFSPDSRYLLFNDDLDLIVFDRYRNERTTTLSMSSPQAWSPDSRRFAYVFSGQNGRETRIATLDNNGIIVNDHAISGDNADSSRGHVYWSADGTKLAYINFGVTINTSEIFVADADGNNARRISPLVLGVQVQSAAWSLDGTQLAYVWQQPTVNLSWFVSVIDVVSGTTTQIVQNVRSRNTPGVSWSPDGRYLAMLVSPFRLTLYDMVTGLENFVTDGALRPQAMAWAVSSNHLAFFTHDANGYIAHIITPNGEVLRRVWLGQDIHMVLP